ncbi:MAG: lysine--tRNA ligase [Deltaproteobacteria bacterium]|nr:lysine--tRNA ligase [Deltaproteobacteria bacterium]
MKVRSQEYTQRLERLKALKARGIDPYPNDFRPSATCAGCVEKYGGLAADALEKTDDPVSVAGRLMIKRDFGKASFGHIQDSTGRIQAYFKKDALGEDGFSLFREIDAGDVIGVEGKPFRTKTGELTIEVKTLRLLSKGLSPLPEKWHGLKDVEARYRQRYLDLMVNPQVRDVFLKRTEIIRLVREFLAARGFIEVETPMMHHVAGGAAAKPFTTHHNALGMDLFLRIAPELYLKRLVIGGFERVFEINKNFRNEGTSTRHNPEFTMLEFYQAYATYEDLMSLTEELVTSIVNKIHSTLRIEYQGQTIDFTPPWQRITVKDAVLKYGPAGEEIFKDRDKALAFLKGLLPKVPDGLSHGKIILEIFEKCAEPKLTGPTFVTHYPIEVSPLSRRSALDPSLADRFELLIAGSEIANAFSELNDPIDQMERFREQVMERAKGDEEAHPMDEDFVRALEYAMPPTAGEGIGIDRLVMLLTDSPSIRDVILFPLLKEEK